MTQVLTKSASPNSSTSLLCKGAVLIFLVLCPLLMFRPQSWQQNQDEGSSQHFAPAERESGTSSAYAPRLLTVREMKEQMRLPCNFVHDGYYISDSNEVLNQVYQSLLELDDSVVPVLVECGGHDGITKSQSLKASICLSMNTLLIEASPTNYNVLKQSRSYDFTVNAALCDGDSTQLIEEAVNSGETHVGAENVEGTVTVKCTSIDAELDKLRAMLPSEQRDNIKLIFLVLDIEGHEAVAIHGIQKYSPQKAFLEMKMLSAPDRDEINSWAVHHNLNRSDRMRNQQDTCYNFDPLITDKPNHLKKLLYGARSAVPKHDYKTSEASKAYMFYGK
jgi:hypothetical protein